MVGSQHQHQNWRGLLAAYGEGDIAAQSGSDLPNLYVFDGTTQRYYDDDSNHGIYTIYTTSFTDDLVDENISFTYYGQDGETVATGPYLVENGVLTINTDVYGTLSGTDQSENTAVADAVNIANENAGFNNSVQIQDTLGEDAVAPAKADVGELRLKLSDKATGATVTSIASGRLTVDVIYQEDEDSLQDADGTGDNAYISLFTNARPIKTCTVKSS